MAGVAVARAAWDGVAASVGRGVWVGALVAVGAVVFVGKGVFVGGSGVAEGATVVGICAWVLVGETAVGFEHAVSRIEAVSNASRSIIVYFFI